MADTTETGIPIRRECAIELPTNLSARRTRCHDLPEDYIVVRRLLAAVAPSTLEPVMTDDGLHDVMLDWLVDGVKIAGTPYIIGYDEDAVYAWAADTGRRAEDDLAELRTWLSSHGIPAA